MLVVWDRFSVFLKISEGDFWFGIKEVGRRDRGSNREEGMILGKG